MNELRDELRSLLDRASDIVDALMEMDSCAKADRALIWELGCVFSGMLGMVPIPATDETIGANLKLINIIKADLARDPSEAESGADIDFGVYLGMEPERSNDWGLAEINRWNNETDGDY